jgi:hypothetical protein
VSSSWWRHSASARVRAPHREKAPGARDGAHAQAHGDGGRGRANTASSRAYVSRLPLEDGLAWTSLHLPSRSSSGNPLGCWLPFPLAIAIHLLPAPTTRVTGYGDEAREPRSICSRAFRHVGRRLTLLTLGRTIHYSWAINLMAVLTCNLGDFAGTASH